MLAPGVWGWAPRSVSPALFLPGRGSGGSSFWPRAPTLWSRCSWKQAPDTPDPAAPPWEAACLPSSLPGRTESPASTPGTTGSRHRRPRRTSVRMFLFSRPALTHTSCGGGLNSLPRGRTAEGMFGQNLTLRCDREGGRRQPGGGWAGGKERDGKGDVPEHIPDLGTGGERRSSGRCATLPLLVRSGNTATLLDRVPERGRPRPRRRALPALQLRSGGPSAPGGCGLLSLRASLCLPSVRGSGCFELIAETRPRARAVRERAQPVRRERGTVLRRLWADPPGEAGRAPGRDAGGRELPHGAAGARA